MAHVAQVRSYYERNTRLFRAFGDDAATHTVHRAIWAAGVKNKTEALTYVNRQVLAAVPIHGSDQHGVGRILDLGCGVGGTICYLAESLADRWYGVGISISPTQIQLARHYAQQLGIARYCTFLEGNYLQLPFAQSFDLAIAIEALVHAPAAEDLLVQTASVLRPGGRLIICDDFFIDTTTENSFADDSAKHIIQAFQRGWHAPGVTTIARLVAYAEACQLKLIEQRDLTPYLRLLDLPFGIVPAWLHATRHVPDTWAFTQSLLGGLALQYGLRHGLFCHQWLVFEKCVAN